MVELNEIRRAEKVLEDVIYETPTIYSYSLSQLSGANVYLKLENLQRTGSFKIRGAYNKLLKLRGKTKNVIAASAGNHAQGVALAARLLGMKAKLIMPEGTPLNKTLAVKHQGADVYIHGNTFDEAYRFAKELERKSGDAFIHAFDDPDVIEGQGTVGLEILRTLADVQAVFVPVGGGGLISGIATAIKESKPSVEIIGVQTSSAPSMALSIKKGIAIEASTFPTIADGISVKKPGEVTFDIVSRHVDGIFTIEESEIEEALLLLTERKRIVVEGAGAAGLAGLLSNKERFQGKKVVVVVSGGNIDINILAKVIERGLVRKGRFIKFVVEIPDVPGSLAKLASLLGSVKANIVQISHDRYSLGLPIDRAMVEISLETKGPQHRDEIMGILSENGYEPREKN